MNTLPLPWFLEETVDYKSANVLIMHWVLHRSTTYICKSESSCYLETALSMKHRWNTRRIGYTGTVHYCMKSMMGPCKLSFEWHPPQISPFTGKFQTFQPSFAQIILAGVQFYWCAPTSIITAPVKERDDLGLEKKPFFKLKIILWLKQWVLMSSPHTVSYININYSINTEFHTKFLSIWQVRKLYVR